MYAPLLFLVIGLGTYIITPDTFDRKYFLKFLFYQIIYYLVIFNVILILLNEFNIIV